MSSTNSVYIVGSGRTAIGSFAGGLAPLSAIQLGAHAVKGTLAKSAIPAAHVEEVFLGNVMSANLGQNPARQVTHHAGIPASASATTVNKVCASGLKALSLGAQSVQLGLADVVVAAGTESMSNVPYYSPSTRSGARYGNTTLVDGIARDGLTDAFDEQPMGLAAELCAETYNISREAQDDYAIQTYQRAQAAIAAGAFVGEILPIEVPQGRGKPAKVIDTDEDASRCDPARLRTVRPAFKPQGGTVTAPNASSLSDGAAAIVIVSESYLASTRATRPAGPVFRILASADGSKAPEEFTTAPSLAIPKALERAGISLDQVDAFEINEAFSVVALANAQILSLDPAKVNIRGGAVALGHPLGCSGARIVVTLCAILEATNGRYGVAAVCNGGGGSSAIVIEQVDAETLSWKL